MIGKLLAINLRGLLAGLFQRGTGRKKRSAGMLLLFGLLFIYVIGVFMFLFGTMFQQMCGQFYAMGIGWLYFALIAVLLFALCVVMSIFTVQSQIFGAKDNELLLSMPVRPSAIVVSRILSLLIYELLFTTMVAVPAIFVWVRSGYATAAGMALLIPSFLLLPLLALAVAALLGWIVALASSRMRNKNLLTMVISLGFLAAYFWLYANMQKYMARLLQSGAEIAEAVRRAAPPAYHFGLAAAQGSGLSFLYFALFAVLPFALMCVILARGFIRIATTRRGAAKIRYRAQTLRASGPRAALIQVELRRFFSNPMIILNAGLGAIFIAALAVVLAVKPSLVLGVVEQLSAAGAGLHPAVLCAAALMLLCSMSTVSASSVSLEGRTLWLIQSLPLRGRDILLSKALTHTLISGAPALLAALVCIARFRMEPLLALVTVTAPISFALLTGFFGVIVNLGFPKFDWTNEIVPVKQGISVLISMFGMMAYAAGLFILYAAVLQGTMDVVIYLELCALLSLLLSGGMYLYICRAGDRRFAALNN